MTTETKKQKRPYRLVTPEVVSRYKAARALQGNGTKAVESLEPGYLAPEQRSNHILKKAKDMNAVEYVDEQLQSIAKKAVIRLGELVDSDDQNVATRNVHYALDHVRGKAITRVQSTNVNVSIEGLLD